MITDITCEVCNTPTKYIFALWDGPNRTHGRTYDCRNGDCEIKQGRNMARDFIEAEKHTVTIINEANMIFPKLIKAKRKELQITISKMAKSLGISPSDYSNYEMCRVALPVDMVDRINEVFREQLRKNMEEKAFREAFKDDDVRMIMNPSKDPGDPVLLKKLIETMRRVGREALDK